MVAAVGHISGGHMNPGVSLAFFLTGGMSLIELLIYLPSQVLGSMAGGVLARLTMDNTTWLETKGGMVNLNEEIVGNEVWQGILCEGLITFLLVLTVLLTVEQGVAAAPLFIGLAMTVGIWHSGRITGGGLNSARAFGPAFSMWIFEAEAYEATYGQNVWEKHWVYWVGPPVGAIIAAIFFKVIFAEVGHRLIKDKDNPRVDEDSNGQPGVEMVHKRGPGYNVTTIVDSNGHQSHSNGAA